MTQLVLVCMVVGMVVAVSDVNIFGIIVPGCM